MKDGLWKCNRAALILVKRFSGSFRSYLSSGVEHAFTDCGPSSIEWGSSINALPKFHLLNHLRQCGLALVKLSLTMFLSHCKHPQILRASQMRPLNRRMPRPKTPLNFPKSRFPDLSLIILQSTNKRSTRQTFQSPIEVSVIRMPKHNLADLDILGSCRGRRFRARSACCAAAPSEGGVG